MKNDGHEYHFHFYARILRTTPTTPFLHHLRSLSESERRNEKHGAGSVNLETVLKILFAAFCALATLWLQV